MATCDKASNNHGDENDIENNLVRVQEAVNQLRTLVTGKTYTCKCLIHANENEIFLFSVFDYL
jgi:hypothetical protein